MLIKQGADDKGRADRLPLRFPKICRFAIAGDHSMTHQSVPHRQRTVSASTQDYKFVHEAMLAQANVDKAAFLAGYFQTGPGQYGEGDRFLGVVVPVVRQLARRFSGLPLSQISQLLDSIYNEERLLALLIMVEQYRKADADQQASLFRSYLQQRHRVNNWNLVDSSAPGILGQHLLHADRCILFELARSTRLWDRRMAVLATQTFIRETDFADTLKLCAMLMTDPQDLMHKACGWMLREVGHRNRALLEHFLLQHQGVMPRTMLRYAIERFEPEQRKRFLLRQPGKKPSTEK